MWRLLEHEAIILYILQISLQIEKTETKTWKMIINNNLWTDVGAQKHNVLKQTQENWSITLNIGFIETETVQDKMCLEV